MSTREVRLEHLIGRTVRDADGRCVGRIEEVRADRVAEECYAREFLLGPAALLRRLLGGVARLRLIRATRLAASEPLAVPWQMMDLSDAEHPRLRVARDALPLPETSQ